VCTDPPHVCPVTTSEDCLFLNVFTPRLAHIQEKPAPVMVFMHGGNFRTYFCGSLLYDGHRLANFSNTVIVSMNYRLGPLGYIMSKNGKFKGNYGIEDQQEALRWVQQNIAAFGGDPNMVTLWGQSAGAVSAAIHLFSPPSAGLYHRILLDSEPYGIPLRSPADAYVLDEQFAKYINCTPGDETCYMAVSADATIEAEMKIMKDFEADPKLLELFMPFAPVINTPIVPTNPIIALRGQDPSVTVQKVDILAGTVAQEGWLFVYTAFPKPASWLEYDGLLAFVFDVKRAFEVGKEYPVPIGTTDARPTAAQVTTDGIFYCINRNITRTLADKGYNIHYWVFDHPLSPALANFTWSTTPACKNVSCHGSDLIFEFDQGGDNPYVKWTGEEGVLGLEMLHYWTNFAHTGDPNTYSTATKRAAAASGRTLPQLLHWPQYQTATSQNIHLHTPNLSVESFFRDEFCDFWDNLGYIWP
jgi:cholinesterase